VKIAIIILNYKGADDTIKCLASVAKQTYTNYQIYLIDNGSHDGSVEKLQPIIKKYKDLIFDIQPENTGFAGGVNIGIKWALKNNFDYVALLNNDATIDKNWLKNMLAATVREKVAMVACLMLDGKGEKIIETGDFYTMWGVPELRDENKPVREASESGSVFGATGGAVLYSAKLFREIGLFDEKLFAYDEDVDIAWRANLRGFRGYYEKSAIVYHNAHATSNKMPGFTVTQVFQNLPVVFWKNVPAGLLWPIGWRFFLAYMMFFGYKIIQGSGWPALKGIVRSWKLWPHAFRERRKIQRMKTVSTREIKKILWPHLPFKSLNRARRFFHLAK